MQFVVVTLTGPEGAAVPAGYGILTDGHTWTAAKGNPPPLSDIEKTCAWVGRDRTDPAAAVSDAWIHATEATPAVGSRQRAVQHRFDRKA